jgi:hypothetical protein
LDEWGFYLTRLPSSAVVFRYGVPLTKDLLLLLFATLFNEELDVSWHVLDLVVSTVKGLSVFLSEEGIGGLHYILATFFVIWNYRRQIQRNGVDVIADGKVFKVVHSWRRHEFCDWPDCACSYYSQ